jgi:hypothetical protein
MISQIESDIFTGCPSLPSVRVPESHQALFESFFDSSDSPS